MNKPFKKDDKVYSVEFGHGVVQDVCLDLTYGVVVRFDIGRNASYDAGGRRTAGEGVFQTLFHANSGEIKFNTTLVPDLKVDQLVWVTDPGHSMPDSSRPETWQPRHFAEFKYDRVFCFPDGRTSLTTPDGMPSLPWEHYSLTDPNKKEIQ